MAGKYFTLSLVVVLMLLGRVAVGQSGPVPDVVPGQAVGQYNVVIDAMGASTSGAPMGTFDFWGGQLESSSDRVGDTLPTDPNAGLIFKGVEYTGGYSGGDIPIWVLSSLVLQNAAGAVTAMGNAMAAAAAGLATGNPVVGVIAFQELGGTGLTYDPNTQTHATMWGGRVEVHHLLPQSKEFEQFFKNADLNVEDFTVTLP